MRGKLRQKLWKWVCLTSLLLLTSVLPSCGLLTQTPPDAAIKLAIIQQLTQTQQSLSQSLGVNSAADTLTPNFSIESINVQTRTKLTDTDLTRSSSKLGQKISQKINQSNVNEVYKVSGTFKAKLNAPGYDKTQPSSPFEIYLGTHTADSNNAESNNIESDTETWYLIPVS